MSKNNLAVKYKKNGVALEILTIPGMMKPYRDSKIKIEDVLASEQIFSNAAKLEKAKIADIRKCCDLISNDDNDNEEEKGKKGKRRTKGSEKGSDKGSDADVNAKALKIILDNGEFQLNAKEMKEMQDRKRAEILNYLHKYYHDPRSTPISPHPIDRIDTVLAGLKIKIDPHMSVEHQIRPIVKLLQEQLPIRPMNPPHEMNLRY